MHIVQRDLQTLPVIISGNGGPDRLNLLNMQGERVSTIKIGMIRCDIPVPQVPQPVIQLPL